MTEQEYKDELNSTREQLKEFEKKNKTILDEYNILQGSVAELEYKTENHYWMIGNYYKIETSDTMFYIHINEIYLLSCGEFKGDIVRIVKDEFKNEKLYPRKMPDDVFIKNGCVRFGLFPNFIQITEQEFNEKTKGLPVVDKEKE